VRIDHLELSAELGAYYARLYGLTRVEACSVPNKRKLFPELDQQFVHSLVDVK
jgi:hypothetical protein